MSLIAVDWGTSALRAARLGEAGELLEERSAPRGILSVAKGEFPSVLRALCADWLEAPGAFCLISGMAGSKQGWVEAPYCQCPAGLQEVAARIIDIEPGRIALVPGLSAESSHSANSADLPPVPDVMRGEEVQIFGAMALTHLQDGLFVLPGTHSKWAHVQDGRVTGFQTFMTGEFYALLARQSILARTLEADAPLHEKAFLQGVARADEAGGLLHHAFGARTLALFERASAAELASTLSGLLIGEELRSAAVETGARVVVIGAPALTQRYRLALSSRGAQVTALGAEAGWAGLHALAQRYLQRNRL